MKQTEKRSGAILQQDRPETEHTQYAYKHTGVKKVSQEENLSPTTSKQNPNSGENKKNSTSSRPPSNPPTESNIKERSQQEEEQSVENLYLSLVKQERAKDDINALENINSLPLKQEQVVDGEEREIPEERYKTINSVIPYSQWCQNNLRIKRRYRKNAIRSRCYQFALDLEDKGFVAGNALDAKELRHWIIGLDLAHDKLTINSYLERLLIYGYFLLKNGQYVFLGSLKPKQLSFVDPKIIRNQVQSSIYARKIRRRAW